jgi:hypothetical protein
VNELQQLIREQRRDDRSYQRPQPGTVPLTDSMLKILSDEVVLRRPMRTQRTDCPVHGRSSLFLRADGLVRCRPCHHEVQRAYSRTHREKRREDYRTWYSRNRDAQRERTRRYDAEHRDAKNARNRAYRERMKVSVG